MADILRMKAVNILARIDGVDDALRIDMLGQRQLHQDAVDPVVGIEPGDQRQQLGFAGCRRQVLLKALDAGSGRRLALVADIDLARRIVADQNSAKSRRDAGFAFSFAAAAATSATKRSARALPSIRFVIDHSSIPISAKPHSMRHTAAAFVLRDAILPSPN